MKATYKDKFCIKSGKFQLICLVYEYRGMEYIVYLGDVQEALCQQHKKEQNRIDALLEIEEKSNAHAQSDAMSDWDDILNDRI